MSVCISTSFFTFNKVFSPLLLFHLCVMFNIHPSIRSDSMITLSSSLCLSIAGGFYNSEGRIFWSSRVSWKSYRSETPSSLSSSVWFGAFALLLVLSYDGITAWTPPPAAGQTLLLLLLHFKAACFFFLISFFWLIWKSFLSIPIFFFFSPAWLCSPTFPAVYPSFLRLQKWFCFDIFLLA